MNPTRTPAALSGGTPDPRRSPNRSARITPFADSPSSTSGLLAVVTGPPELTQTARPRPTTTNALPAFAKHWFLGEMRGAQASIHALRPLCCCGGLLLGFLDTTLRGFGQVVFMNSSATGLCILVGLLWANPTAALLGLLGCGVATACGVLLESDGLRCTRVRDGLYGYSGQLLGMAVGALAALPPPGDSANTPVGGGTGSFAASLAGLAVLTCLFAACSSLLCVALGRLLRPYQLPYLTLPFCLTAVCLFGGAQYYSSGALAVPPSWGARTPSFNHGDIVTCLRDTNNGSSSIDSGMNTNSSTSSSSSSTTFTTTTINLNTNSSTNSAASRNSTASTCADSPVAAVVVAVLQSASEVFVLSDPVAGALILAGMVTARPSPLYLRSSARSHRALPPTLWAWMASTCTRGCGATTRC